MKKVINEEKNQSIHPNKNLALNDATLLGVGKWSLALQGFKYDHIQVASLKYVS